jgi:hypothetical protein
MKWGNFNLIIHDEESIEIVLTLENQEMEHYSSRLYS